VLKFKVAHYRPINPLSPSNSRASTDIISNWSTTNSAPEVYRESGILQNYLDDALG
jgi:hypothetical protein